jgi:uncharacterized protein YggE
MSATTRSLCAAWVVFALGLAAADRVVADTPDDVVLHIVAQGVAHVPPDKMVATVWTSEQGDSLDAARAAFQAAIDRRKSTLAAAGIAVTVVTAPEPTTNSVAAIPVTIPPKPAIPSAAPAAAGISPQIYIRPPASTAKASHSFQTTGQVEFTVNNVDRLDDKQLAILRSNFPGTLKASLTDERRGHEAAVADAVAKARADAALYAADMGFHVVQVKSLGNDGGLDLSGILAMIQRESAKSNDPTTVQVTASLRVDFVVAPN